MTLKAAAGWNAFRTEPDEPISYIWKDVHVRVPTNDIKFARVFILSVADDKMTAQVLFSGYFEFWTITDGKVVADYLDDSEEICSAAFAGSVETYNPVRDQETLERLLVEFAEQIDVRSSIDSYEEVFPSEKEEVDHETILDIVDPGGRSFRA